MVSGYFFLSLKTSCLMGLEIQASFLFYLFIYLVFIIYICFKLFFCIEGIHCCNCSRNLVFFFSLFNIAVIMPIRRSFSSEVSGNV